MSKVIKVFPFCEGHSSDLTSSSHSIPKQDIIRRNEIIEDVKKKKESKTSVLLKAGKKIMNSLRWMHIRDDIPAKRKRMPYNFEYPTGQMRERRNQWKQGLRRSLNVDNISISDNQSPSRKHSLQQYNRFSIQKQSSPRRVCEYADNMGVVVRRHFRNISPPSMRIQRSRSPSICESRTEEEREVDDLSANDTAWKKENKPNYLNMPLTDDKSNIREGCISRAITEKVLSYRKSMNPAVLNVSHKNFTTSKFPVGRKEGDCLESSSSNQLSSEFTSENGMREPFSNVMKRIVEKPQGEYKGRPLRNDGKPCIHRSLIDGKMAPSGKSFLARSEDENRTKSVIYSPLVNEGFDDERVSKHKSNINKFLTDKDLEESKIRSIMKETKRVFVEPSDRHEEEEKYKSFSQMKTLINPTDKKGTRSLSSQNEKLKNFSKSVKKLRDRDSSPNQALNENVKRRTAQPFDGNLKSRSDQPDQANIDKYPKSLDDYMKMSMREADKKSWLRIKSINSRKNEANSISPSRIQKNSNAEEKISECIPGYILDKHLRSETNNLKDISTVSRSQKERPFKHSNERKSPTRDSILNPSFNRTLAARRVNVVEDDTDNEDWDNIFDAPPKMWANYRSTGRARK